MTPLRDSPRRVPRSARERGFTLLELVVALAIVGALLVVAFGGLRVAVAAWQRGDERAEAHQHARSITLTVARAVGASYAYRAPRAEGERSVMLFRGDAGRVEFVTQAPLFPPAIPVAFTAVVIELREGGERPGLAVRQRVLPNHRPFLDAAPVLEDGTVTALRLSYLGDGGWQTEWDAEAQGGLLPRAIRVAMDTGKGGAAGDVPALTVAVGAVKR